MAKRPLNEHEMAARAVALNTHIPLRTDDPMNPGRRDLLDMLDLRDGRAIKPPPPGQKKQSGTGMAQVHGSFKRKQAPTGDGPVADRALVPAGLRNLPDQAAS